MSGSESGPAAAPAAPAGLGDNKGIRFTVKTGGKSWECTLQDRSAYERTKATRTNSSDSLDSSSSASTQNSA